jgi:hypothetical protein
LQEEVMARTPRNLDELKSSIEESMAEALEQQRPQNDGSGPSETATFDAAPPLDADPPTNGGARATEAGSDADRLAQTCNTTAAEIQATGEAVMQVANSIAAETQALAELLRKHGAAIAARIEEFTAMSKRVSEKLNAAREEVLVTGGAAPSIAPQLERDEKK